MTKQQQPSTKQQRSFVFNVEIMLEDEHHATALEKLLHGLNSCDWRDYRVTSGIQLGELIEEQTAKSGAATEIPVEISKPSPESTEAKLQPSEAAGLDHIKGFMKNNVLIRLIVNRGLGIKLNIPCRIINMDESESLITVYHVDEKQVYTFRLNEIEDFIG
ncbi:hypothetical protein ACFQZE_00075 [Paenibacillus sp. GCM10027627]|uniref:hypothetical protein n=1 Tax=unclassified Paenibacillus TaxID=185978 RepID=UPI00362A7C3B